MGSGEEGGGAGCRVWSGECGVGCGMRGVMGGRVSGGLSGDSTKSSDNNLKLNFYSVYSVYRCK